MDTMVDDRLDTLRRIVAAAVLAPSAENTQPWHFTGSVDSLTVSLDLTRTLASEVDYMLSLTALGAAIENAVLAASECALRTNVEILADSVEPLGEDFVPVARLRFKEGGEPDRLSGFVKQRATARRLDHRRSVAGEKLSELESSCRPFRRVSLHWVGEDQLRDFATLVGTGNRMRFEYAPFHRELYENLRFRADDVRRNGDGLDVATLQLPPGVAMVLWTLRSWRRTKLANLFGYSKSVGRQAASEVQRSGKVGFLTIDCAGVDSLVDAGRALERLWLTATRLGLKFHPVASLPVFLAHARTGGQKLCPVHRRRAQAMAERFGEMFPGVCGRVLTMAFRIGYGPLPQARSIRRTLSSVLDLNETD